MFGYRFLSSAAVALGLYGVLGLLIAGTMLIVGSSTLGQLSALQKTLESERVSLVQAIRTVSGTLHDTSGATSNFVASINSARGSADQAAKLASDSAGSFRATGAQLAGLNVFGFQPLASVGPQFDTSADQLLQLSAALGSTRDALAQNGNDVQRVGGDLGTLQTQLDAVVSSLSQPGVLGMDSNGLLPFQVAFYGMCLLVILQSAFALIAAIALYRVARAVGTEALFPSLRQQALPAAPDGPADPDRMSLVR